MRSKVESRKSKVRNGRTSPQPSPPGRGGKPGAVIYVGPRVGLLKPGDTFVERPEFLKRYVAACPAIEQLLVPAADWLRLRGEVARRGSALWFAAEAVLKSLGSRQ